MSARILDISKKTSHSRARARTHMSPLFPQKTERLKTRRRKKRLIVAILSFFMMGGIATGVGFLSQWERINVQSVSIVGAHAVSGEVLKNMVEEKMSGTFASLFPRSNIFIYPHTDIESGIKESFPRIQHVTLSRPSLLAQAVIVTVIERTAFGTWCDTTHCYLLDERGFIYAETNTEEGTMRFEGGLLPGVPPIGQTFLRGRMNDVIGMLEKIRDAGHVPTRLSVENEHDFILALESGFSLMQSFDNDSDKLVHDLQLALDAEALRGREAELEYIDMRFGNRVYYRFKNKE